VVNAWADLPTPIRAAVLALVKTACPSKACPSGAGIVEGK
jgi:hypothetical protein